MTKKSPTDDKPAHHEWGFTLIEATERVKKELISEFLEKLKTCKRIAEENEKYEPFIGSIAQWQFIYLINEYEKRLKE